MPNIRWLLSLITRIHRAVFLRSGGRIGSNMGGFTFLLLEHVGRRTGQHRLAPLLYVRDGESWIVVASNAGDDRDPAWWLNLQANPEATIRVGRERHAVKARRASAEETRRLWPVLDASYRYYPEYRERARREIPVVILEPTS